MSLTEQVTDKLVSQQVPAFKAAKMTASLGRGLWLILIGAALGFASLGTLYWMVIQLKNEPGVMAMILILGLAASGLYFLVAGGNIMSGQALDATADSPIFGTLAKLIRLWKGGGNPA